MSARFGGAHVSVRQVGHNVVNTTRDGREAMQTLFEETPDLSDRTALQNLGGILYGAQPSVALDALHAATIEACHQGRVKDALRYANAMSEHIRHVRSMEIELSGFDCYD